MRICYISYVKYGEGSWVHTSQFIATLKKIHHDVKVYTPLAHQGATTPVAKRSSNREGSTSPGLMNNFREIRLLAVMFTRRAIGELRLLRNVKPDVVILRQERYLSSILLCRLFNIPIIVEVNGPALENQFLPKDEQLRGKAFWQWLEKKMLAMPDHIMVVSKTLKQHYVTCCIPYQKITCIPNGVDIHTFNPDITGDRIRDKLDLKGKTVVGFSGTFAPWHGIGFLADAMKRIIESKKYKDVVLLLVGKPGYAITMPDLPDAVTTITGHIPHEEMPEYLAVIDIFVAPYPEIAPFYFSPLKIFEAMSMGKPVIASAQGQICELITDNISGLLYPPGDQSALIKNIERLICDTQFRNDLGQNARKMIETNFTWKDNANRMLNLCKQVVDQKKRKRPC
ncbi:Glycosyltransferase involved in cell wall bisynthesis [Candidatus Electrothrix aarhusensis]